MRVVGTAGHVDHGKSSLVQALTGINPDRLQEEQAREMTIELGFAWLTLPHGESISFVDVPGHEGFIKNMLAGAGGMDAVLLVIAADEGIMPQTREHLAILDLLKIQGGVVALTKMDLPLETGWLPLVQEEIRGALKGTALEDAEIIPVSAKTRLGLDELQLALEHVLARVTEKNDRNRPRLPIDRVFTMSGFGTVVTGTLSDGNFSIGDEVEIAPQGLRARVRGLQTHKQTVSSAQPGARLAMNLANVATDEIARGNVVIQPDSYMPTSLLDAQIEWLASAPKPLTHNQELDLFLYASEVTTHVRLLQGDALPPGERGWGQLVLAQPVIAAKGDRFILRYPSPSITVGGGVIIEPYPSERHRRHRPEVIASLERVAEGTPDLLVLEFIEAHPASQGQEIASGTELDSASVQAILNELMNKGAVLALNGEAMLLYVTSAVYQRWHADIERELAAYHKQFPMRAGMPREEFKSRLKLPASIFEAVISHEIADGALVGNAKTVRLATHRAVFAPNTQEKVNAILEKFANAPYNPPSLTETEALVGEEVVNALIEQGVLERVSPNVLLAANSVETMQQWVIATIQARGQVTGAELRDHFDTSRKYAIAFLEYLDAKRVTRRVGDARVLRD